MKLHQLTIQAHSQPELLERVLRTVRHRGFRLAAINMVPQVDCKDLHITVTVESDRPVHLLQSQLAKLIDVLHVEVQAEAQHQAFAIRA